LRRMSALQDVLGDLQDHHVSERLLSLHLKALPNRTVRANLRTHVQVPLSAGTIRAGAALGEAWEDFKATKPFWR
jgi:CHAD domain-containing protein